MTTITLKISGIHCTACPLNIDDSLEELPGVISAKTSYAKQESVITFDPKLAKPSQFTTTIQKLGYAVTQ